MDLATAGFYLSAFNILLIVGVGIYAKSLDYKFGKQSEKDKINLAEIRELHTKMHDGLNRFLKSMTKEQEAEEKVVDRLVFCASRLSRYDETIPKDISQLTTNWPMILFIMEDTPMTKMSVQEYSKRRQGLYDLIKTVKRKVDKIWEEYLKS